MTETLPAPDDAARSTALDLGAILGGPFRDPRAFPKFLGGCLAVVAIVFFGIGLLALFGFLFQTARRARAGEEHPMPEWGDLAELLGDGLRVLAVILGYLLPVAVLALVLAILTVIPLFGALISVLLTPLTFLLSLLGLVLIPVAVGRMVASNEIASAFQIQENLRYLQEHLGTYVVFLLIGILIEILSGASVALCLVGAIPGTFWGYAAAGDALGRLARATGI